nr:hypothetical protein [Variovorax sp. E3]
MADQGGAGAFAKDRRVVEQFPCGAFAGLGREVDLLGVFLALMAGRVRGPHARHRHPVALEDSVRRRAVRRRGRRNAIARVVVDRAQLADDSRLDVVEVGHGAALVQLLVGELQRPVPGRIGRLHLVERVDQRVAARQAHRHAVGLELHFARQGAVGQHHEAEQAVHHRADGPHQQREQPADPGNAHIGARQAFEKAVEPVALGHDVRRDLLRQVDPSAHRHAALGEVPELVREHRLELGNRQYVDQRQPDLQVLLRGQ